MSIEETQLDVTNPFSPILSASLLLGWHGVRSDRQGFVDAGVAIEAGVGMAIAGGMATRDLAGRLSTKSTAEALAATIRALA